MANRTSLTISLGQFDVCPGEPDRNMAVVREWIAEAARRGSDMVVFPELWDTGYALDRAQTLASGGTEGRFAEIAELAREHHIHIVGSMLELGLTIGTSRPAYNTATWFDAEGVSLGSYRKIHLFRFTPLYEDQYLLPGGMPHWFETPWGPAAVAICYDLRFPELFRTYAAVGGAVITVVPAQWPLARIEHWQTLLRARAIENQMIVIGCNRVGESEGQVYGGSSVIYDAFGHLIVDAGTDETLVTATLNLKEMHDLRDRFPVLDDRRPELYDIYHH